MRHAPACLALLLCFCCSTLACTVVLEPDPGGSGGAGGGGSGAGGSPPPVARPPVILLVQDRSGSMDACFGDEPASAIGEGCGVDGNDDGTPDTPLRSRMDVAQLVMQDALGRHFDDVLYGLVLYGVSPTNLSCGDAVVAVPVATETADAVRNLYASDPRIERPAGGTPTTRALRAAHDELVDPATGTLKHPDRANYVLLLTDGLMNCNPEHELPCRCSLEAGCPGGVPLGVEIATGQREMCLDDAGSVLEVQRLAQEGIKTFVIGLGNLAADPVGIEVLNQLAVAGGAPRDHFFLKFYPAAGHEELQQVIESLFDSVVTP